MRERRNSFSQLLAVAHLPQAIGASDAEVLGFINRRALFGLGIGYIDVHLVAATLLPPNGRLWTRDRRLHDVAMRFDLSARGQH